MPPSDYPKFKDVIGLEEVVKDFKEIVDCIQNREKYDQMGATLPRGILLEGPPGTGKTLLARALANECKCTFYYKSGSELEDMFVGQAAQKIKLLFKKAKENAPCVIFIDEIDSVAGNRTAVSFGSEGKEISDNLMHKNILYIRYYLSFFKNSLIFIFLKPLQYKTLSNQQPSINCFWKWMDSRQWTKYWL